MTPASLRERLTALRDIAAELEELSSNGASVRFAWMGQQIRASLLALETPEPTCWPWQPMATAPKGRKVLLHYVNALGNDRIVMARYYLPRTLELHDEQSSVDCDYNPDTDECWALEGWYEEHDQDAPIYSVAGTPDAWMPLPPIPPSATAEQE